MITTKKPTSIGELREALKYRSREAMNNNWSQIFDGEVLPDDHLYVDASQVLSFLEKIATPQRGRPGTITGAAQQLLKNMNGTAAQVPKVVFESDVSEKVESESSFVLDFSKNTESEAVDLSQNIETVQVQVSENKPALWQKVSDLSGLDWVYLVTVGIADYGLILLLKEMGFAAGIVYTLISFHALAMAKDRKSQRTASTGIAAVWMLEILAFFVHLTLFNSRLWSSIAELPFVVDDVSEESRPFWIAVILATLFSAAGIYAVSTTLALLKEKIEAEAFEEKHGVKY